jgi:hypothetical protein
MALSTRPGDDHLDENLAIWNAATTLKQEDYFNQYLDGSQSPNDFEHEPELGHLLTKLYERQRQDAYELLDRAIGRIHPDGEEAAAHIIHKKEFREDFHKECELFAKERDRYIREYQDAKAIRAEMNQASQQEALDIDKSQERGI